MLYSARAAWFGNQNWSIHCNFLKLRQLLSSIKNLRCTNPIFRRNRLHDGSRSSSGPEEVKQTTHEPDVIVSHLAGLISQTVSKSFAPPENTTSGPSTNLFGDADQGTTDSESFYIPATSISTVSHPISTSTDTENYRDSDESFSDSISSWGTSAASTLDYQTEQDTANNSLPGTVGVLSSTNTLLPSSIYTRMQVSALTDPPLEDIAKQFASVEDDKTRGPSQSRHRLVPSTDASLISTPAQILTATANMQNPQIDSTPLSLVAAKETSGVGVSDMDVTGTLSQTANPSNPTGYDPTMYNTRASQAISRQSLGATLGAVSGAGLFFTIVYILQRFGHVYSRKFKTRTGSTASIEVESNTVESDSIRSPSEKEISRFSIDS